MHFDGKIVPEFTDSKLSSKERCPILVSSPDFEGNKLLGIPAISSSKGADQVEGLLLLLEEYDIKDNIFATCCDSIAAQTEKYNGAMTLLD